MFIIYLKILPKYFVLAIRHVHVPKHNFMCLPSKREGGGGLYIFFFNSEQIASNVFRTVII